MVSPDGIVLNVNATALRALGYRREELLGNPLNRIYAPECLPKMKELLAKWRQKGCLESEEMVIISKTGERRSVLLCASAVRDENEEILHSVSIQRDITNVKLGDTNGNDPVHRVSQRHLRIGGPHE